MAHVDDLESAFNTEETVLVFVCLFVFPDTLIMSLCRGNHSTLNQWLTLKSGGDYGKPMAVCQDQRVQFFSQLSVVIDMWDCRPNFART